jgi:hypothetical protein
MPEMQSTCVPVGEKLKTPTRDETVRGDVRLGTSMGATTTTRAPLRAQDIDPINEVEMHGPARDYSCSLLGEAATS